MLKREFPWEGILSWCAIELEIQMADLLKKLDMKLSAVSYAVKRGEMTAKEAGYYLDD